MSDFLDALGTFSCGFVLGYFWYPMWELGKKIVSEAKKAKEQW